MNILHVIPSLSPEHGGPSESVWRLALGLKKMGLGEVALWTTDMDTSGKFIQQCKSQLPNAEFFKGFHSPLGSFSPRFTLNMWRRVREFDLVHIHSVFNYTTMTAAWICHNRKVPYVISPRGMFQSWSLRQNQFVKQLFRLIILNRQMRNAAGLHATSELEEESLREQIPGADIITVPNPLPNVLSLSAPFLDQFPEFQGKRILLYLSRIHPKKGVSELLEAWRRVTNDFPAWHLVLVGPGHHANVKKMQTSITQLRLRERVSWLGPLFDGDRDEAYRAAELFIQPSHQENFGNSIAEALAAGCPVITTRETPWSILEEKKWGWWVPMTVDALEGALRNALALSSRDLKAKGTTAKQWIESACAVESVSLRMADWYQHLLGSS